MIGKVSSIFKMVVQENILPKAICIKDNKCLKDIEIVQILISTIKQQDEEQKNLAATIAELEDKLLKNTGEIFDSQ